VLQGLEFLLTGVVFGLTGGLTPGPTLTLVIAQTLRFGLKEGLKVAISPLLTDTPIVLGSILVLSRIEAEPVLGTVSFLGSCFLAYLAYDCFRATPPGLGDRARPRSLRKGFLANLLNPHPYLFWLTIGGPTALKAYGLAPAAAALFIVGHYSCLVGAKIVVAALVERGRSSLIRGYPYIMRGLGVVLGLFAVFFLRDGLRLLGL